MARITGKTTRARKAAGDAPPTYATLLRRLRAAKRALARAESREYLQSSECEEPGSPLDPAQPDRWYAAHLAAGEARAKVREAQIALRNIPVLTDRT